MLNESVANSITRCGDLNTTFYNVSFSYVHPEGTLVTTYSQLFASMQSQLLTIILYGNVLFLMLCVAAMETTRDLAPTWWEILKGKADRKMLKYTVVRSIAGISFPVSLFFVLLLISVKMGYNW